MADPDCITLEDSDDEPKTQQIIVRKEDMIRCNMCLDPGLLPVEEDRPRHRLSVHANKLFFCDICEPHEKGAKGFEDFKDVVKHVCHENGILPGDKKNLHEMIRIPGQKDFLKVFKCLFCPGDGVKFVGMKEECFLEHIRNQHGDKAPRRKPEKLIRECRICYVVCSTDTELSEHVTTHMNRRGAHPFAGFGPRVHDDGDSLSEGELVNSQDMKSREWENRTNEFMELLKKRKKREPPSSESEKSDSSMDHAMELKRKRKHRKSSTLGSPGKGRSQDKKRKYSPPRYPSKHRTPPRIKDSGRKSLSRDFVRSSEKKRRESNYSPPQSKKWICPFCPTAIKDLEIHLEDFHQAQCFKCKNCPGKLFVSVDRAIDHCKYEHGDKNPLDSLRIVFPENLEKILCVFCDPPEIFVGKSIDGLQMDLFHHLELHEKIHNGRESIIQAKVLYCCRVCPGKRFSENDLLNHVYKHNLVLDAGPKEKLSGSINWRALSRERRGSSKERRVPSSDRTGPSKERRVPSRERRVVSREERYKGGSKEPVKTRSSSRRGFLPETKKSETVSRHGPREARSPFPGRRRSQDMRGHRSPGTGRKRSYDSGRDKTQVPKHKPTSGSYAHRFSPSPERTKKDFHRNISSTRASSENYKPPLDDRPDEIYYKCKICFETFTDIKPFPAMDHVQTKHKSSLPRNFEEKDLMKLIVNPILLMSVACKICSKEYLSDVQTLKAPLREHREVHKDVSISVNDMFQLECRLCDEVQTSLIRVGSMTEHIQTHIGHEKTETGREDNNKSKHRDKHRDGVKVEEKKYNPIMNINRHLATGRKENRENEEKSRIRIKDRLGKRPDWKEDESMSKSRGNIGDRFGGRGRFGGNDRNQKFQSNWVCSSCRFDNFGRNTRCKKCNKPPSASGSNSGFLTGGNVSQDKRTPRPVIIDPAEEIRLQIEMMHKEAAEKFETVRYIISSLLDSVQEHSRNKEEKEKKGMEVESFLRNIRLDMEPSASLELEKSENVSGVSEDLAPSSPEYVPETSDEEGEDTQEQTSSLVGEQNDLQEPEQTTKPEHNTELENNREPEHNTAPEQSTELDHSNELVHSTKLEQSTEQVQSTELQKITELEHETEKLVQKDTNLSLKDFSPTSMESSEQQESSPTKKDPSPSEQETSQLGQEPSSSEQKPRQFEQEPSPHKQEPSPHKQEHGPSEQEPSQEPIPSEHEPSPHAQEHSPTHPLQEHNLTLPGPLPSVQEPPEGKDDDIKINEDVDENPESPIKVESVKHLKELMEQDKTGEKRYFIPPELSKTPEYLEFLQDRQDTWEEHDAIQNTEDSKPE